MIPAIKAFIKKVRLESANKKLDRFLAKLKSNTFKVSYDKKDIPPFIQNKFYSLAGHGSSIANPDEEYDAGDIISGFDVPSQQLIFHAISDDMFVATYAYGGFVPGQGIILIEFNRKRITGSWTGDGYGLRDLTSVEQISNYIEENYRNESGELIATNY